MAGQARVVIQVLAVVAQAETQEEAVILEPLRQLVRRVLEMVLAVTVRAAVVAGAAVRPATTLTPKMQAMAARAVVLEVKALFMFTQARKVFT
jgi:hypothetical protein